VTATTLAEALPALNASLNGLSGLLVVAGWIAIRRGRRALHRRLMIAAVCSSVLFLAGYLTRVALTGTHRFPGAGWLRAIYLAVLGSHTLLAMVVAPLVLVTLTLGLRERFGTHRRVARWTVPVWIYVSVTGVAVYVLLYRVAGV
jgi:putative membrane protein